jgi:hypothetical protein
MSVLDPVGTAKRVQLEQENEKLKADVARLRHSISEVLKSEIVGDYMVKEDWEPLYWDMYEALSATASSDAWLKERDAKVKLAVLEHVLDSRKY